ncbi:MFS transporter [Amycolatopsis keratiniphila]|uniref:Major facilitator superfamily MFS_1 n=1 Tax=Amycolatopsis keratiniphila TaxID=129921 RepID=R4T4A3_9PSEU|nr:MFS transporter [Amycolatopsis keratiniphila]AGM07256.1 major facilitator superfamily MFS_1 [Amycolatopsis keratiniphila]
MRERAAVLLLCAAQSVDVLGVTIAVIGLPEIGRRFPGAEASTQWVVSGYALLFGGFLVSAGRVADRYGHRRTFVWGMAAFLAASLAGGLAPGFLFGGLLVHYAGWRSIFLLNVPICLAVLLFARSLLPARTERAGRGSLDLPGAMLVTGGLLAATGTVRVVLSWALSPCWRPSSWWRSR